MNILVLNWRDTTHPKSGGAEIITMGHAAGWVKDGHKVTWFTSHFDGAPSVESIQGVTIVRQGNFFTVFFYAFLYYIKKRHQFDLVVDEIHGLPFFTPLYVRKPIVAFIHEVAKEIWDYMYPFPLNVIGRRIIEPLYFRLYRNIPFWTDAPSTIVDLVSMGIQKNQCIAIGCPVSCAVLTRPQRKAKSPTFLFVSRIVRMKGIEEVIAAFALIKKKVPDAVLWVVGSGDASYDKYLRAYIAALGIKEAVVLWGKVSEKKKLGLMSRAHVLLHASVREGWGLVVKEAASQGTPSIVYNVAGLRDVVLDGKTGVVLSQNTPLAMQMASLELIENKTKYLSFVAQCLETAGKPTWADAVRQSLDLLKHASRS